MKPLVLLLVSLLFHGCGYSLGFKQREIVTSSGERRPIRTIAVPIFENRSLRRELEFPLTEAVIREVQRRTPLVVTSPERADVTLRGVIEGFDQSVLVQGPDDSVLESSAIVALGVSAVDREGRELFRYTGPRPRPGTSGPALLEASQFAVPGGQTTQGLPLERPTADAFTNLAERVVMLLEEPMKRSAPPSGAQARSR